MSERGFGPRAAGEATIYYLVRRSEMGKRGIQDILSETRDGVLCIEKNTRERVEALMERYEKDKGNRIKMGNEALRSAVTSDLLPRYE